MMDKQILRRQIRQRKQEFLSASESVAVIAHLRKVPHLFQAHTLLLYYALPDEVQTQPLLDELVAQGKTVLLPRVVSNTDMELCHYTSQQDLKPGAYGILEPIGKVFTTYNQIDVAVIPGMAFDMQGHRLGRGRGYYDRFLARLSPHVYKIGLCFPWQIVDEVPTDGHDVLMDIVIS